MDEIQNPNFQMRKPGGDTRALLVLVLLSLAIVFCHRYFTHPARPADSPHQDEAHGLSSGSTQTKAATAAAAIAGGTQSRKPLGQQQDSFGWLAFIAKPLYLALRFFHEHGIGNWGWAIIALTFAFNAMTLWPRVMAMKSSLKMMRVQPKVDALKAKYAHLGFNDPKRVEMNAALAALYKAEGTNLFGGCLPTLLQMPLLFAYVRVLQNAAELHGAHWLWLADLSLPDPLHILPILIVGSMVLVQYLTPMPAMDANQRRILAFLMPLIMGFTLWRYASGLALYWLTCNLFNLGFQWMVNRSAMGREMRNLASARTRSA